jgi:hypothetical protein
MQLSRDALHLLTDTKIAVGEHLLMLASDAVQMRAPTALLYLAASKLLCMCPHGMVQVRVIAVMDKERAAMQKLHKQYQKERMDQEGIEGEYGERMRRVNEDLRVAKVLLLYSSFTALLEGEYSERMRRVNEDLRVVEVLLLLYSCFTALLAAWLMRYCFTQAITAAATALRMLYSLLAPLRCCCFTSCVTALLMLSCFTEGPRRCLGTPSMSRNAFSQSEAFTALLMRCCFTQAVSVARRPLSVHVA